MEYRAAAASCHPLLVSTHAALLPPGTSFRGVCPPVHPAIVPLRTPQYPQSLADPPPVHRDWRGSIGKRNPARPCDTPCRTVNRIDSQAIPSLWLVTPSVVSEHSLEVPGSLIQSPSSRSTSCVRLELGPLSSADITRPPRSYRPVRHPQQPGLALAGNRLNGIAIHRQGLPVLRRSLCARVPPSIPRRNGEVHSSFASPVIAAFPESWVRSASASFIFEACPTFTPRFSPPPP